MSKIDGVNGIYKLKREQQTKEVALEFVDFLEASDQNGLTGNIFLNHLLISRLFL